eukprot:CAMPEP_0174861762 /NCGR_PEP_ID=MMETSP1114-20130205/52369_1 /TAXON_ID=312471 /ORGANISM="Neobodo designis, Strain CCAP 1951/1" /LENGTH=61 /DNA_ID=CAMNT_0016096785 /DNA_START=22 /DNA_END=203 /DNA_ORIENTATION=-
MPVCDTVMGFGPDRSCQLTSVVPCEAERPRKQKRNERDVLELLLDVGNGMNTRTEDALPTV